MKAFYLPNKKIKRNLRHSFVHEEQLKNKCQNKRFPNMLCTFLLFKARAFLQIFFPRNLLFRQVSRTSVFVSSKCLKTSNKKTHIPLIINQFVSLIEQDVGIDKLLN